MITKFSSSKLSYTQRYHGMMAGKQYSDLFFTWMLGYVGASGAYGSPYVRCLPNGSIQFATNTAATSLATMSQVSLTGSLAYQNGFSYNNYGQSMGIETDASGNTYVLANTWNTGQTFSYVTVAKYTSAGALTWTKFNTHATTTSATGIAVDSAGGVVTVGMLGSGSPRPAILVKRDSSGTLLWSRQIADTTNTYDFVANAVAVDSTANIYTGGYGAYKALGYNYAVALLMKHDSSGNLVWQKGLTSIQPQFGSGETQPRIEAVYVDASNNIFTVGRGTYGGTNNSVYVTKWDTSGNVVWFQALYSGTSITTWQSFSITTSVTGDVYVGCGITAGAGIDGYLFKLTSAGAVTWIRTLTRSGSTDEYITSVTCDINGDPIIGANIGAAWFGRFPQSGLKTGTYTIGAFTVNYAAAALSFTAGNTYYIITPTYSQGTNVVSDFTVSPVTSTPTATSTSQVL